MVIARPTVPADLPCEHCGLPVGAHPSGADPYFCCSGCMLVFDALKSAGFSDTFYHLRELTPDHVVSRPVLQQVDRLQLAEMDTASFQEEHTRVADDGTRSVVFYLDGVHCAACVWLVERMPFEIAGIKSARLDLSRARLTLHFDPQVVHLSEAASWLSRFGYVVNPLNQQAGNNRTGAERRLLIKMGISWALAGNVMLFAFALYAGLGQSASNIANDTSLAIGARWASLALALISVSYGGSEFFRKAWASVSLSWRLRSLQGLHMDTPIALGILVGFGHSAWATWTGGGEIWFDSITVLIAALLTARWLQLRSRRMAGDASDRLLNLVPSMARLVERTARLEVADLVRVETLRTGDIIEVPAGEVVPADGFVIAGRSMVDKSVLTGESQPEGIEAGMRIEAGVTNLQAPIEVRVSAAGQHTRVGKLLSWIRDSESRRAPVVLMADRLSGYFVGALLVIALLTSIGWLLVDPAQVVPHVVALLVISCPCALGMATPLAMAVASGRAARMGVFIKSDEATEQLAAVNTVVLDKTGTLTEGRMSVVSYAGDLSAIRLAAKLETQSNHPIARAILGWEPGWDRQLSSDLHTLGLQAFEVVSGNGVRGRVDGVDVIAGRPAWVVKQASKSPHLEVVMQNFAQAGHTPVAIAVGGRLVAALAIGDRIRHDAYVLLDTLKREGKEVFLLSGDHEVVVQQIAKKLGITASCAHGDVSPERKRDFIEELRMDVHRKIAMVGDGVNDAAALLAADVGIAVEGGSTPSRAAADVFITRKGVQPVVDTLHGARQVMAVIKRNLGFSLLYNMLGAGAAISGFVTPLVAAVAMPISSLIVVLASVLQRSFNLHPKTDSKP